MGISQRLSDLLENLQEPGQVSLRARSLAKQGRERAALDELHGEERTAICQPTNLMHRWNAWMLKLPGDASLIQKPCLTCRITLPQHDLDRQRPLEVRIDGA